MVMKSILTISCLVAMVFANPIDDRNILALRLTMLKEDMNATCSNLTKGNHHIVNEVVFETNCNKAAYQDTFCQVNRALLSCKDYTSNIFSAFLHGKDANCTSGKNLISVNDLCSKTMAYIQNLYRKCTFKRQKRSSFNIA